SARCSAPLRVATRSRASASRPPRRRVAQAFSGRIRGRGVRHTPSGRPPMTPGALILCGGHSRRMGRPKAWLPFGPARMLQRVVRLVGQAAGPIVVVAAEGQDIPALPPSVTVVRVAVSDRGPLQGLAAGLAA